MNNNRTQLSTIKQLTLNQYDGCKDAVKQRIRKSNGDKPTREKMKREQTPLLTPLDWLAFVVFVAAFMVSSLHIIDHVGNISEEAYNTARTGLMRHISRDAYVTISQLGMIFLAEASMLLFMTTWRTDTKNTPQIHHKLTVALFLAVLAMVFVLVANISSGLSLLEALMPPLFTIGLGFQLEKIVFQMLERREQLNSRYHEKIQHWETVDDEPEKHEAYRTLLMREIWDKLSRLKANINYQDVSKNTRLAAVERELERDSWVVEQVQIKTAVEDGIATTEDIPEDELEQLKFLLKHSEPDYKGKIDCGRYVANLSTMTWKDIAKNKTHGPYKKRGSMSMSISMLINRRKKRIIPTVVVSGVDNA